MCAWIIQPLRGLVENAVVPVIWSDGIGAMALSDGVLTTYYYSVRDPLHGTEQELTVECIIKRPAHRLVQAVSQGAMALDYMMSHQRPPPLVPGHPPEPWKPHLVTT